VSVSSTFYEQIWHTKVLGAAFFVFIGCVRIIYQKKISQKDVHKMMFKLTVGSNNMVALSAMKIDANKNIRSVELERRKCRFPGISFTPNFIMITAPKYRTFHKATPLSSNEKIIFRFVKRCSFLMLPQCEVVGEIIIRRVRGP